MDICEEFNTAFLVMRHEGECIAVFEYPLNAAVPVEGCLHVAHVTGVYLCNTGSYVERSGTWDNGVDCNLKFRVRAVCHNVHRPRSCAASILFQDEDDAGASLEHISNSEAMTLIGMCEVDMWAATEVKKNSSSAVLNMDFEYRGKMLLENPDTPRLESKEG